MYYDTQGICIQNEVITSPLVTIVCPTSSKEITEEPCHISAATSSMSKRIPNQELEPVRKNPKISRYSFSKRRIDKPENYQASVAREDVSWIVSCKTNGQTPMWSGWNSTITNDNLPAQKIGYLVNIGVPTTQHDVVNEAMKSKISLAEVHSNNL